MRKATIALVCLLTPIGMVQAQDQNRKQAEALVREAVAFAKQQGKEALLRETNLATGRFHIKKGSSLYLFIYDQAGLCIAHGSKPVLVGLNRLESKDPDGKFYVKEFIALTKSKGKGWVDYKYPDPTTGKIQPKSTYVEAFQDMVVCAGAY